MLDRLAKGLAMLRGAVEQELPLDQIPAALLRHARRLQASIMKN